MTIDEIRVLRSGITDAAKRHMLISRTKSCQVSNFPTIAPFDTAPVAYVADEADARFFAAAPAIVDFLWENCLKGVCVYCGKIEQYESVEQKEGAEGERMRIEHIKQCVKRPELKLIAAIQDLSDAITKAAILAGVIDGSQSLSGPQLVMLCDDLAAAALSRQTP